MTRAEYNNVKRIESKKWISTLDFIIAIIQICTIIFRYEQNYVVISGLCAVIWTILGIWNMIDYKKATKSIEFEEENNVL